MTPEELAGVFRAGADAALTGEDLPSELYAPAAVARALLAMEARTLEIGVRGKAGAVPVPDPATPATGRMTYRNPVIAWRPESAEPGGEPRIEPPPVPFTVTRSEVVIRPGQAPVVYIWFAVIPAVPR
jgi:hypothetical protein